MRILVVDDEENVRKGLETFLRLSGHEVVPVPDLDGARASIAAEGRNLDAAIVDVFVGKDYGVELLDYAAALGRRLPVVMMSGQGRVRDAVAALRKGARDFLEKPLDTERLLAILGNIERESATERRIEGLEDAWLEEHVHLSHGSAFHAAIEEARRAAASPLSILVTGPTGTGKELVARWIHLCSPRSNGPFVAVNCAAVSPDLADSAFFGSRRGAFTGADADREGWFQAARGGTLFLDEVGELGPQIQAKLLRATESGEVQPVGASQASRVDLRIVAATNRDLEAAALAGGFRSDLYWRLAQVRITLPSLAGQASEVRGLASFFERAIGAEMGTGAPRLDEGALAWLEARDWPGNVRELRAFVKRALWLAPPGSWVGAGFLVSLDARAGTCAPEPPRVPPTDGAPVAERKDILSLSEAKERFERDYVAQALEASGGSVSEAAGLLGLLPNNLSRKLKELGLR